jgi:hypothetical protein
VIFAPQAGRMTKKGTNVLNAIMDSKQLMMELLAQNAQLGISLHQAILSHVMSAKMDTVKIMMKAVVNVGVIVCVLFLEAVKVVFLGIFIRVLVKLMKILDLVLLGIFMLKRVM